MNHALFIVLLFLFAPAYAQDFDNCTEDCSGHQAGYEWAEENGITDPDDCDGRSQSFIEGCEAWAEESSEDVQSCDDADDPEQAEEDGECEW